MTPHPQRCETCLNGECDLHPENQASLNPDTGYEWDHYHWYHAIIDRKGCASHSSVQEPSVSLVQDEDGYVENRPVHQQSEQETERILDTLKCIENAALACVWSDAPDCPGAEDGEIICDGCPLFEWIDPEQLRDYIKEKMAELRSKQGGEP